ncbi:uncharacterized protein PHACADRAFT_208322 [Phanerochaete carnosa HHB-10118-sp]|uniref:Uncharacterized protein n=1 Tax=Phanerochaete carnosa (strain HHB-10118-sp) TaxID=650164 RepID=K5V3N5_PHACS|nr:uncharacterized protein PHACADRAFT_208322 [Phanerochaete carnosa HHB-10118-sp]EKM57196.1 hypothetical protein PHACADRAFT_208322 [Phanerochaete carnosa HHB-10118-sp]
MDRGHQTARMPTLTGQGGVSLGDDFERTRPTPEMGYAWTRASERRGKRVNDFLGEAASEARTKDPTGHTICSDYAVGDSKAPPYGQGLHPVGLVSDINNTVTKHFADEAARSIAFAALHPLSAPRDHPSILHATAYPRPTFNDILSALSPYGCGTEYYWCVMWRCQVGLRVTEVQDDALFPLLHFVADDLATSIKARPSSAA